MIEEILTASGIPFRQGRYLNPPSTTYAVYFDDQEVDGATRRAARRRWS